MDHFGQWLSDAVYQLPLNLTQFASKTGISYAALRAWCKQPHPFIRPDNLTRIANGLGIPRQKLIELYTSKSAHYTPPRRSGSNGVSSPPQHVSQATAGD